MGKFDRPAIFRHPKPSNTALDVTIKPRAPSAHPVRSFVVVDPRPFPQQTEKNVPRRPDHNPRVSSPHHQIARLRPRHSHKSLDSAVQLRRTRIRITEARSFVDCMHQMRTVALRTHPRLRIQRRRNHRQAIIRSKRAIALSSAIPTPTLPRRARSPTRSRKLLRPQAHSKSKK